MLRKKFSLEKLKNDLFSYLAGSPYYQKIMNGYPVELVKSYNDQSLIDEIISILPNDFIYIFALKMSDFVAYNELFYHVQIIIGSYEHEYKQGPVSVDKCFATLKYCKDFKLYDIVFHKEE